MADILYTQEQLIQFTRLGLEDLFFGTGSQTVTRFGETYTITEINAGNMPFNASGTLQEVLDTQYPAVQNTSNNMIAVQTVSTNIDAIKQASIDITNWYKINAAATAGVATSASYNPLTNTINFVLEPGPQGVQGVQGVQGPVGPMGAGVTILGSDTIANIIIKTGTIGDMWLSTTVGTDDASTAVAIGDGIVYDGANWLTVGPIRGPQGVQGPTGATGAQGIQGIQGIQGPAGSDATVVFADQAAVDAGLQSDVVVSPVTLKNYAQWSAKIGATNYATSTVGGTVKARLDGTTLYLTINGTDA